MSNFFAKLNKMKSIQDVKAKLEAGQDQSDEDSEEQTADSSSSSDDENPQSDIIPNATVLRNRSLEQHYPEIKVSYQSLDGYENMIELPKITQMNQIIYINRYISDVLTQFVPSVLFTNNANHQAVLIKLGDLWCNKKIRKQFIAKNDWKKTKK